MHLLLVSVLAILISKINAVDPITFPKNGKVATLLNSNSPITLYTFPIGSQPAGIQFPYTKNVATADLASVYLKDDSQNLSKLLMTNFDVIHQTCVCYWINATDYPTFKSSTGYYLELDAVTGSYAVKSGTFEIVNSKLPSPTPTPSPNDNSTSNASGPSFQFSLSVILLAVATTFLLTH